MMTMIGFKFACKTFFLESKIYINSNFNKLIIIINDNKNNNEKKSLKEL